MGLKELQELRANRDKPKEKKVYRIPKKSAKKIAKEKEEKANPESRKKRLQDWYERIEEKHWGATGFAACQETGELIPRQYARAAIAHLLCKKLFHSVETNDENYLVLSPSNGSHQKTDRIDKFTQMRVWPIAAKKINSLLPLLPDDELRLISKQLYDALENY